METFAIPRLTASVVVGVLVQLTLVACSTHEALTSPTHTPSATAASSSSASTQVTRQTVIQVWPTSTSVVWAWTQDQTDPNGPQALLRSADGGQHWTAVTPSGFGAQNSDNVIASLVATDADHAWMTLTGVASDSPETAMLTDDGGQHWQPIGALPGGGCDLDFVTVQQGWCVLGKAAAGSGSVTIYRTGDGGRHWQLLSTSSPPTTAVTRPGELPFGCDKSVSFSPANIGWALFYCGGGMPALYRSTDGGRIWQRSYVGPAGGDLAGGAGFSAPVQVTGLAGAVAFKTDQPVHTLIYCTADAGASWSPVTPPDPNHHWLTYLVTPTTWRLIDGNLLEGTDDGGATWFHTVMNHAFSTATLGGLPHATGFVTATTAFINADDGLWRTTDTGRHWDHVPIPGT